MFVSTTQAGQLMAMPDVCNVPSPVGPIPTPFPNTGMCNQATKFSMKVKICMKEALTKKSELPQSIGDEAGSAGGIVSGMIKGPIKYMKGSSKVKIEGQPCVHLTSMTAHNGTNANAPAGTQVAPSQTKVIVAP